MNLGHTADVGRPGASAREWFSSLQNFAADPLGPRHLPRANSNASDVLSLCPSFLSSAETAFLTVP